MKQSEEAIVDVVKEGGVSQSSDSYFRTMSRSDFKDLQVTGRLTATSETFISPTESFASNYKGVLVEFSVKPGTAESLADIGVRNKSWLTRQAYPELPLVEKGWTGSSAFFKGEGSQINIGLGQGTALNTFNDSVTEFSRVVHVNPPLAPAIVTVERLLDNSDASDPMKDPR